MRTEGDAVLFLVRAESGERMAIPWSRSAALKMLGCLAACLTRGGEPFGHNRSRPEVSVMRRSSSADFLYMG